MGTQATFDESSLPRTGHLARIFSDEPNPDVRPHHDPFKRGFEMQHHCLSNVTELVIVRQLLWQISNQ